MGKFYQVRQSDAHAWVEAYLAAGDIPPEMRWGDDDERWEGGAWLRLDATPPSAEIAGHCALDKARQGFNWIDSLWDDYVMEMDRQRQEEAVYQPAGRGDPSDGPQSVQIRGVVAAANCTD